ncbi:MAG: phosphoethanolamine transferase [Planctomycetota bacterium]
MSAKVCFMGLNAKHQIDKISCFIGILLCSLPILINIFTVRLFLSKYIGDNLSLHFSISLSVGNFFCIILGILVLTGKITLTKKLLLIPFFLSIYFLPHLYSFAIFDNLGHTVEMIYAETLNIAIFMPLLLLLPRIGIITIFFIQAVFCFIQVFYTYHYRLPPDESLLFILIETNLEQAAGYATEYLLSFPVVVSILLSFLVMFLFARTILKTGKKDMRSFLCVFVLLLLPSLLLLYNRDFRKQVLRKNYFFGYYDYTKLQKQNEDILNLSLDQLEEIDFKFERPLKEIHVMIIGESADRDHMSLYGYNRRTTPMLEAIGSELFLFDDVIASFLNSIPNMKALLTFENDQMRTGLPNKATVIHYIKKADYKTYWISNKNPLGLRDTLATIMAKNCDMRSFVRFEKSHTGQGFDEILLEPIADVLSEDANKKYIFVHLMGQHGPFRLRYPDGYGIFKDIVEGKTEKQSEIINHYDNATRYNDFIVASIIKKVRAESAYSSVLYISDHGQNIYDNGNFYGHCMQEGLEVPFVLWLSDSYKQTRPEQTELFKSYLGRKYKTDDVGHSVFDLLGVEFDSSDTTRSIFSPDFKNRKRIIHTFNYRGGTDYDTRNKSK